jgi:RNA polymerase sigma-70 factor (ECF subfamily)
MLEKSLQQLALDFVSSRSERTFTHLHNRLKPGLRKFITKYHQDLDTIDEILAITLSKAYVYVDKYDDRWNFSTWIYKICQNECLMEIRRKNSISSLNNMIDNKVTIKAMNDDDWKTVPEYEVFADEDVVQPETLYEEVLEEIRNLPEHYKEIIEDRIVDKMKYKDIADKRGLKINTVRSRIHSAKKVIKNMWIERRKNDSTSSKTINILGVTILQLLGDDDKSSKNQKLENLTNVIITRARYGAGNAWFEVTEKFSKIFSEKGEVKASNRLGGDPCYGSPKMLIVDYTSEGKIYTSEIKEGKLFSV